MIGKYPLWKSRKFWLLILDIVLSSAAFFGARYLDPDAQEIVKFVVLVLQPVFTMLIGAYAYQTVKLAE